MRALGVLLVALAACSPELAAEPAAFPWDDEVGGKTDAFGRKLSGIADPYVPDRELAARETELRADMRARRDAAWATVFKVLEPVPLLGLAEDLAAHPEIELPADIPRVPRFQTWYAADDFKRMFQFLYEDLGVAARRGREPFAPASIEAAFVWNADALERSQSWPLERYIREVEDLGECPAGLEPAECDALFQRNAAGAAGGIARIMYGSATMGHALANYGTMLDCLGELDTLAMDATPDEDDNFTRCFDEELPADAVLVKAQWERADFGRDLPAFATDAAALAARLSGAAEWTAERRVSPGPQDIYTIVLRNGSVYRLAGLHIMTKELRHWQWTTLWWSDEPDSDFGADRPDAIREGLPEVFSHYKMCTTTFFEEADTDPAARYADMPSLAAALATTAGKPTWCSNPYLEHGKGNASSNCIGCHQHGGATVTGTGGALVPLDLEALIADEQRFPAHGRLQQREVFPADYMYSFNRVDDLAHAIRSEVEFFDFRDGQAVRPRVDAIVGLPRDAEAGAITFADRCAGCHGPDGAGSGFAPSLFERVPARDDAALVQTLIQGRGQMPAWGEVLGDVALADVLGFLRAQFDAPA